MTDTTLLVLSGMGVAPYSARGLSQSIEIVDAAKSMRRTINGVLRDVSEPQFRKYKTTISCNDQDAPALDGYFPGMEVVVDCVAELSFAIHSGAPARPVVTGSERTENGFTFYRPQLTMLVTGFNETKDEYGATTSWTLDLEEV